MSQIYSNFIAGLNSYVPGIGNVLPEIETVIKNVVFISILILCYIAVSFLSRYLSWKISRELPPEHQYIGKPLHQIIRVILCVPTIIGLLWWWGIDVSHLVISAGLIGSVLLFVLRSPIENTLSAFLLIVQYRLKYDQDITIIGSGGTFSGKLIYLDLGHVFLQGKKDVYIIPNATVNQSIVKLSAKDIVDITSEFCRIGKKEELMLKRIKQKEKTLVKDIEKI